VQRDIEALRARVKRPAALDGAAEPRTIIKESPRGRVATADSVEAVLNYGVYGFDPV
jgi:hypothetical protein